MKLSPHFDSAEFACRCGCGASTVDPRLVSLLETIHAKINRPIHIVSGKRCAAHNAQVGGAKHSQHVEGKAADIQASGHTPAELHAVISQLHNSHLAHVGGLGLYGSFVHVDVRDGVARWRG